MLIAPAVWAGIPVVQGAADQLPTAGPTEQLGPGGFGPDDDAASSQSGLVAYLVAHQGSATYPVAVDSSMQADSLILATNRPVMALRGVTGSDPILTADPLARLVASGQVPYALGVPADIAAAIAVLNRLVNYLSLVVVGPLLLAIPGSAGGCVPEPDDA